MIGFDFQYTDLTPAVTKAADDASFKNVSHAAASIRKDAIASIETSDQPSRPGSPPHTRRGRLPRAIKFAVDEQKLSAVIGPEESVVGDAGAAHEHGEELFGDDYPARPFMGPSLDRNIPRFGDSFAGSIGN